MSVRYCVACGAEREGLAVCEEHGGGAMADQNAYAGPTSGIGGGPLDLTDRIIAYEQGELDEDAIVSLFQALVNNGMAWRLQGSYGRMAMRLIEAGLVVRPGNR